MVCELIERGFLMPKKLLALFGLAYFAWVIALIWWVHRTPAELLQAELQLMRPVRSLLELAAVCGVAAGILSLIQRFRNRRR